MHFSGSECPKIDGGWGFAPEPTGGAYSAPPDPLAGFKRKGPRGRDGERGGKGKGRGGGEEEGEKWEGPPGKGRGKGWEREREEGKGVEEEEGEKGGIAPWAQGGIAPLLAG